MSQNSWSAESYIFQGRGLAFRDHLHHLDGIRTDGELRAEMVKIQFLGTGNAFCANDRLHSLVLIDEHILVDAPPTIVPQLRRAGVQPSDICDLLITHWHGDHTFGLPFLLLERRYISDREGKANLTIYCHEGGGKILQNLCDLAYPDSLTNLPWMNFDESQSGVIGDWKFFGIF